MTTSLEEKKNHLLAMIDDMTAAALDKSAHGYTQFLLCRQHLLDLIDKFVLEENRRTLLARDIFKILSELYHFDCTNNPT